MALEENIAHANRKRIDRIPDVIINLRMINSETDFRSRDTISICIIGAIVAYPHHYHKWCRQHSP